MSKFQVTSPDGVTYEVNAPEGATQEQAIKYVQENMMQKPSEPMQQTTIGQDIRQGLGNLAAGAVRGAGSIGSTLYESTPIAAVQRALNGKGFLQSRSERLHDVDMGLSGMGADPDSGLYKTGKIGTEIAGTVGLPGAIAKVGQAAKLTSPLVEALRTGGLTSQVGLGTRIGAGAVTGGASAGLVNPEDAGTGALIGGAIPGAASLIKGAGNIARSWLGASTGVGDEALSQAFQAGKAGGAQSQAFRENLRGQAPMTDALDAAKQNLDAIAQQRQAAYRSGMTNIKSDKTVLDFSDIDGALNNALDVATYKGKVTNPEAASVIQKIQQQVDEWKSLNPNEFHTPEGMDALKRSISGVLDSIPMEQKTAQKVGSTIYNSIKSTINKQAPEYAKVMKDYSEATDLIREIEKGVVGGQKSTAEQSMRKLQSLMRNNVNTSYGMRTQLAKQLEQAGGKSIMAPLAGQALQEWTPRGIQRAVAGGGVPTLAATGNPIAAAALAAASSPRLMGESFYGAGRLSSMAPSGVRGILEESTVPISSILGTQ